MTPPGQVYIFPDGRPAHRKHCVPPLGLAYIAGYLRKMNYEVYVCDVLAEGYDNERIIDGSIVYGLSGEALCKRIKEIKPDIIGLSILFSSVVTAAYQQCQDIKESFPEIPLVLGGQHPTGAADHVMQNPNIDYVIKGEGEIAFYTLLEALNGRVKIDDVLGLHYRKDNQVIDTMKNITPAVKGNGWNYYKTKDTLIPQKLDELPWPAWDLFDMKKYWACSSRPGSGDVLRERYGVMVTSRGCPHVCFYCTSPLQSGYRGFRKRSEDDVIDEIRNYIETYQLEEIMFFDDNFFVAKPRSKRILKRLAKEFPETYFSVPAGTEVNQLDEEYIDLLAKANVYKITLNIESPDLKIQEEMIDKHVNINAVPEKIALLKKKGIETRAMLMMGFPGQSKKSIEYTIDYAKKLPVDDFMLSIVCPLPGTPLYDQCKDENLFLEGFSIDEIRYSLSRIRLVDINPDELENLRHKVWKAEFQDRRSKLPDQDRHKHFGSVKEYELSDFSVLNSSTQNNY